MENRDIKTTDKLQTMFDELRVQAHLFKAEMRDEWSAIDTLWSRHKKQMSKTASETSKDISEDARRLKAELEIRAKRLNEQWNRHH